MARQDADVPIPLAVVAGFLGAGKTTFLASYARRIPAGRRVAFLINEFAATDMDSPLLAGAAACTVGVSGGSIFCRCKVTEFISQLSRLPVEHPGLDGVVVEASGMADPSAGRSLLDESRLDRIYAFQGTLTLADPGTLHKVLDTLPAAERQIASADLVVVTKSDLHPAERVASAEALVRTINPQVPIVRAVHGDCRIDPLALGSARWVDGEVAACADPGLVAVEAVVAAPVAALAVGSALAAIGDGLVRAKGFLPTRTGWVHLDWAAGRLDLRDCGPADGGLVLIVKPEAADAARRLAERITTDGFPA